MRIDEKQLTVSKPITRNQVVFIEWSQRLSNYSNGLLVRIWSVTDCVQAPIIEWIFPFEEGKREKKEMEKEKNIWMIIIKDFLWKYA